MKMRTLLFPYLAALLLILLSSCGSKERHVVSDVLLDPRLISQPSPSLGPATKLAQSFVAPHNGLTNIQIFLGTYTKTIPSGTLNFRLLAGENGSKVIATGSVPLQQIKDNTFVGFDFPAQANSQGKVYTVELSTKDMPAGYLLAAWLSKTDLYPGGKFMVNGVPVDADAALTIGSDVSY